MWPRGTRVAVVTRAVKKEHAAEVLAAIKRTGAVRRILATKTYGGNYITFLGVPGRKAVAWKTH